MSRNQDHTSGDVSIADTQDKNSDYRMFSERGKSDKAYKSFEGARMATELDSEDLIDSRTDLIKLCWQPATQRGLIDDRWW